MLNLDVSVVFYPISIFLFLYFCDFVYCFIFDSEVFYSISISKFLFILWWHISAMARLHIAAKGELPTHLKTA